MESVRDTAARRIREVGQYLIDRADGMVADMDEAYLTEDGLRIFAEVPYDSLSTVELRKSYVVTGGGPHG